MKHKKSSPLNNPHELQGEWRKVYNSKRNKMSRGAQNIAASRPHGKNEEWRGRFKDNHKKAL